MDTRKSNNDISKDIYPLVPNGGWIDLTNDKGRYHLSSEAMRRDFSMGQRIKLPEPVADILSRGHPA